MEGMKKFPLLILKFSTDYKETIHLKNFKSLLYSMPYQEPKNIEVLSFIVKDNQVLARETIPVLKQTLYSWEKYKITITLLLWN